MFGRKQEAQETTPTEGPSAPPVSLLTVVGDTAKMEGKFQIADSIQVDCEVGGELRVGGTLIISKKGVVNATVETVDAIIQGHYEGNMTATGNVEIAATGCVLGNIKTDSLVITKGGCFRGTVAKTNEEPGEAVHESDGQFIAGKQRFFEPALPGDPAVVGMREDGSNDPFRVTFRTKDLAAAKRVIVEARPPFVVEVVQECDDTPVVFVFAVEARIAANRGFDVIFLDPPYAGDLYEPVLEAIERSTLLDADGFLIAQHFKKRALPERMGRLARVRSVRVGDHVLSFYAWCT